MGQPRSSAARLGGRLWIHPIDEDEMTDLAQHLRETVEKVDDPRARAMFETAAEVLLGLDNAFADFEEGAESAWR